LPRDELALALHVSPSHFLASPALALETFPSRVSLA
jgi:hypothetical protein